MIRRNFCHQLGSSSQRANRRGWLLHILTRFIGSGGGSQAKVLFHVIKSNKIKSCNREKEGVHTVGERREKITILCVERIEALCHCTSNIALSPAKLLDYFL